MNLLLDTNIIIPMEPATSADLEVASPDAVRLFNVAQEVGAGLFIHPLQVRDIENDSDASRRTLRLLLVQKYRQLPNPPPLTDSVREAANRPEERSHTWIVQRPGTKHYAGVAIVNPENREWPGARNPTLKICTFKVSESATGAKLGELLLRAIFDYAHANRAETLFVEVFPKHGALLHLLHQFGFEIAYEKPGSTELVLRKRMAPTTPDDDRLSGWDYAKKFGPFSVKWSGVSAFVVPIEPRFHALLSRKGNRKARCWRAATRSGTRSLKLTSDALTWLQTHL